MKITDDWLIGFIEGEGSFFIQYWKSPREGLEPYYYPQFSIGQKDEKILNDIRDYLGFGFVRTNFKNMNGKRIKIWKFIVNKKIDNEKIRNLCKGRLRTGFKQAQFKKWEEAFISKRRVYEFTEKHKESMSNKRKGGHWVFVKKE